MVNKDVYVSNVTVLHIPAGIPVGPALNLQTAPNIAKSVLILKIYYGSNDVKLENFIP